METPGHSRQPSTSQGRAPKNQPSHYLALRCLASRIMRKSVSAVQAPRPAVPSHGGPKQTRTPSFSYELPVPRQKGLGFFLFYCLVSLPGDLPLLVLGRDHTCLTDEGAGGQLTPHNHSQVGSWDLPQALLAALELREGKTNGQLI